MENTVTKLARDSFQKQKKIAIDGDIMIDKRADEVLNPEVDYN